MQDDDEQGTHSTAEHGTTAVGERLPSHTQPGDIPGNIAEEVNAANSVVVEVDIVSLEGDWIENL